MYRDLFNVEDVARMIPRLCGFLASPFKLFRDLGHTSLETELRDYDSNVDKRIQSPLSYH